MLNIFGAGGGTFELLESKNFFDFPLAFKKITCIEDSPERDFFNEDIPIISLEDFKNCEIDPLFDFFFISAADVFFKERIDRMYPGLKWLSFVHRNCDCLLESPGVGNWVGYGVHICSNVKLGRHIRFNFGCVVPHNCEVGDYSFIGINATVCGQTKIGKGVFVGSGATIINKDITVGDFSVIGAGSVVTKDVEPYSIVMGVPARKTGEVTREVTISNKQMELI
jgi:acetyltransferase-like isoleucine patch superfamily enzyme